MLNCECKTVNVTFFPLLIDPHNSKDKKFKKRIKLQKPAEPYSLAIITLVIQVSE